MKKELKNAIREVMESFTDHVMFSIEHDNTFAVSEETLEELIAEHVVITGNEGLLDEILEELMENSSVFEELLHEAGLEYTADYYDIYRDYPLIVFKKRG